MKSDQEEFREENLTTRERFEELKLRYQELGKVVGSPPNFDPGEEDE